MLISDTYIELMNCPARSKCYFCPCSHTQPLAHIAMYLLTKTPEQGAQTTLHCAVATEVEGQYGTFWDNSAVRKPSKAALDDEACKKLWEYSVEQLGLN